MAKSPPQEDAPPALAKLGWSWRTEIRDAVSEVARHNRQMRNGQPITAQALSEEIVEQWLIRRGHLSPRRNR